MKLLFLSFFLLIFLSSCSKKNITKNPTEQISISEQIHRHPKFKHFIEINSVPHPFDVDGTHPYVLWINGKKMNTFKIKHQLAEIVNSFEEEEIQAPPYPDIHQGWMSSNLFTRKNDLHEILLKNARSSTKN